MSFISYMGGKHAISKRIIPLFPKHQKYVEVFMGSAAVFFAKPKVKVSILNDFNRHLVNLFEILRDHPDELKRWIQFTPKSRSLYDSYTVELRNDFKNIDSRIARAGMYMYVHGLSYNNKVGQGFTVTGTRITEFSELWRNTLDYYSSLLNGVAIENLDFEKLITRYDGADTFMYLDPPYYVADDTAYYEFVFNKNDHLRLFNVLKSTKCNWMMSYDDNEYIKKLYSDFNITIIENHPLPSASKFDGDRYRNEIIITNYQLEKLQYSLQF